MAVWYYYGDGLKLWEETYAPFNLVPRLGPGFAPQMGGWFRRKINTIGDFKGLKMRMGTGLGGRVISRAGGTAILTPAAEIYRAFERGVIDAAEWVGPHDDEKLGFHKVAKYMHVPGVLEMEANNCLFINKAKWAELSPSYQAMLRGACSYAQVDMLAGYDAKNAKAISRVVAAGAQLVVLTPETLRALRTALEQVLDEESAKSEQFKKICENWRAFRAEQHRWFAIADARTEMSVYSMSST